jgi:hypothetical protein
MDADADLTGTRYRLRQLKDLEYLRPTGLGESDRSHRCTSCSPEKPIGFGQHPS